jgi:hypothetical protein
LANGCAVITRGVLVVSNRRWYTLGQGLATALSAVVAVAIVLYLMLAAIVGGHPF